VPIFECSRCNELTYSASRESAEPCPRCGEERHRVLDIGFENVHTAPRDLGHGDHATHTYSDPALIAPFCARYLTEGINEGERVMAVAPADLRRAIEPLLGADVNVLVEWQDPLAIYGDFEAERVAAMYDALIGAEPRAVRILAILNHACTADITPSEFDRYEAMAHDIVNRHGATAICMYDARGLDPAFLDAAARRHPLAVADGAVLRNDSFEFAPV
jgi:hypothetical protein